MFALMMIIMIWMFVSFIRFIVKACLFFVPLGIIWMIIRSLLARRYY